MVHARGHSDSCKIQTKKEKVVVVEEEIEETRLTVFLSGHNSGKLLYCSFYCGE